MAERPVSSDDLVAEVVLRRFASASPDALVGAVVRDLARAVREDHVALDLATLEGGAPRALAALAREGRLCEFLDASAAPGALGPPLVVVDGRFLYLRRLAVAEHRVAAVLAAARASELAPPRGVSAAAFAAAARELGDELAGHATPSPELAEVAWRCLTRRVSFVVGGPGTGKTWLATQVLRLVDRCLARSGAGPLTFAVAAPTGKAARRVSETIAQVMAGDGFTHLVRDVEREGSLHRLLEVHPTGPARVGALHHDLIIVDEVSMADLVLLDLLLRATRGDGDHLPRVVLIGDPHQLASVNVGAVLADAVAPEARDEDLVSRLSTVRRTGQRSLIDLAAAVNAGDPAATLAALEAPGVVEHRADVQDETVVRRVLEHAREVAERAAAGDGVGALEALRRRCVLSATVEGPGSVRWWNARVGAAHRRRFPVEAGERFSVGEPVLVTRNQRALDLSNGDLGVVVEQAGRRVIRFEGGRELPVGGVGHVETAWAMTIHKAQGSEFGHVVVVLPRAESPLLTRELLYTGITRARDAVTVLGSREAIARAVATPVSRVSGLTHRLSAWPVDERGGRTGQ